MEPNNYGLTHLWTHADPVIIVTAALLLLMSLSSWATLLSKALRLWRLKQTVSTAARLLDGPVAGALRELAGQAADGPHQQLLARANEARHGDATGLEARTASQLKRGLGRIRGELESGLTLLASVGATAPFIGLFGTVWGIYHALVQIGLTGQASLDSVAGPVGEALIMTAFGLAVAIPAVLAYNAFVRIQRVIMAELNDFAELLLAHGAPSTSVPQANQPQAGLQIAGEAA